MTTTNKTTQAGLWAIIVPGHKPEILSRQVRTLAQAHSVRDAVRTEAGKERAFVCMAMEADIIARKWQARA